MGKRALRDCTGPFHLVQCLLPLRVLLALLCLHPVSGIYIGDGILEYFRDPNLSEFLTAQWRDRSEPECRGSSSESDPVCHRI